MTRSVTVALLHLAPELGALDENRALIQSGTRAAAEVGADWVISGELFNTLFAIGSDGRLLGRQRKLNPIPGSEEWASAGQPGNPLLIDDIRVGLLVCADVYSPLPAMRLRDAGAQLLVSSAAWWPGEWGPKGEWEARTLETGLRLIVCNRTGRGRESQLADSESVIVDRGEKLLALRAPDSRLFAVECTLRDGHIARCEVNAAFALESD